MSLYLGLVTAYGAAAVLIWMVALLRPEAIPAARDHMPQNKILQLCLFLLAIAGAAVLQVMESRGWLLPTDDVLATALNQLLIFLPMLIYLVAQRSPAAAMVPSNGLLKSLAVGVLLTLTALAAYLSARDALGTLPDLVGRILSVSQVERFMRVLMLDLTVATLMALLAGKWSRRTALVTLALLVLAAHVGAAYHAGFGIDAVWGVLLGSAAGFGLMAAIVYTRNIVWFLPLHGVLGVLLFVGD